MQVMAMPARFTEVGKKPERTQRSASVRAAAGGQPMSAFAKACAPVGPECHGDSNSNNGRRRTPLPLERPFRLQTHADASPTIRRQAGDEGSGFGRAERGLLGEPHRQFAKARGPRRRVNAELSCKPFRHERANVSLGETL